MEAAALCIEAVAIVYHEKPQLRLAAVACLVVVEVEAEEHCPLPSNQREALGVSFPNNS